MTHYTVLYKFGVFGIRLFTNYSITIKVLSLLLNKM